MERGLLIEGWRGVNHSYALINQHQILGMKRIGGLNLFHKDLPFALSHWNTRDNGPGFSAADRETLDSLPEPHHDADDVDAVYRICSPFRSGDRTVYADLRTTTFMVTELGLCAANFAPGDDGTDFFTRDANLIVTPSEWSRSRILEYGFDSDCIHTVPHGVDTATFHPPWPDARMRHRTALGIREDETLFLNVGPPLWNKGIDVLLKAFALLRLRGAKVRLIIKDQKDVYGLGVDGLLQSVGAAFPALLQPSVLSGITTISLNLSPQQLAGLYGAADCYVSPYRAEGFNLPVLEAIACGTPTIVTHGGATDDFCSDATSLQIPGQFHRKHADAGPAGAYVEPELDSLYDAMSAISTGWRPDRVRFDHARQALLQQFNWQHAAEETVRLALH